MAFRPALPLAELDRRLNGPKDAPVGVAVSGGGDSIALLRLAHQWAVGAGRRLVVLTVDHGLQPCSGAWARFVAERAEGLGYSHRTLVWGGEKPATGIPEAARVARHRLLAEAARAAGARVVLLGHTADDRLEAGLMRELGSRVPEPRRWSPSPAWPQGRGLFLMRPLVDCRRSALREWLASLGETWVEDPANDDERSLRTRARRRLAELPPDFEAPPAGDPLPCPTFGEVTAGPGGELTLPRGSVARRLLGALALCAAGTARPPRRETLDALLERLRGQSDFVCALAGARIEASGENLTVCREPGELVRAQVGEAPLPLGQSVFDGRFLLTASAPGYAVRPLRGLAASLSKAERAKLHTLPAAVRPCLPLAQGPGSAPFLPGFRADGPVIARPLTHERLAGALGALVEEASLWRVEKLIERP
jgi:tRNA(Ile)-lysidine synthase